MKEYKVRIGIIGDIFVNVEAKNKKDAIELALAKGSIENIGEWFSVDDDVSVSEIDYNL